MKSSAVCIVGYNRFAPLRELLLSLNEVVPVDRNIDYILSLDYSEYQKDIIKMVNGLELNYKLIINSSNEKLGLKSHILKCGDILNDRTYEYVVILEDDLEVSNYFLSYIESVLTVLEDDVAGISLYSYKKDEFFQFDFSPKHDGYDNYYMQYASSWGQAWTEKMWKDFREWLVKNDCESFADPLVPKYICNWPKSSWKKHYIRYLTNENKYFIYPHVSLTCNKGVDGTHHRGIGNLWSVPVLQGPKEWNLSSFSDSKSIYNVNFLPKGVSDFRTRRDLYDCFFSSNAIGIKGYLYLLFLSFKKKFL